MTDKGELVRKCYENLSIPTVEEELHRILPNLALSECDDTSKKLLKLKEFIEKHNRIFHDKCGDINIVLGIIDYLNLYANVRYNKKLSPLRSSDLASPCKDMAMLFYTLYFMFGDQALVQIFSKYFCKAKEHNILRHLNYEFCTAVIIFEDSDFHFAVDSLKKRSLQNHIKLSAILIQESAKEEFEMLSEVQMYYDKISYFRNKQEVCAQIVKQGVLDCVSIWSENIISAKALAEIIQVPVVFINGSVEICRQITLPAVEKYFKTKYSIGTTDLPTPSLISKDLNEKCNVHYLFYNNMWNAPSAEKYWKDNEDMWADASMADIIKCIDSAIAGFKTWRSLPLDRKKQCLRKFITLIRNKSDAEDILSYLDTPQLLQETLSRSGDRTVEVTEIRKPCGVVLITGVDRLFIRLGQALLSGNSVILLCNHREAKSLTENIEVSLSCGFPPGVLNFLTSATIGPAINFLSEVDSTAGTNYDSPMILIDTAEDETEFTERDDDEGIEVVKRFYWKYTLPKYVLLPIK